MRLCVPIPCFFQGNLMEAIRKVRSFGYDAAEIYGWKDLNLNAVKAACEESGVEMISMCTSEFRMTDDAFRKEWLKGLEESCRAARIVGVKRLITQVGQDTGADRRIQHENIVDTLRLAIPVLEEYDVTVMIEPLNTYVDHPGYYLWSSTEAFDIIRQVSHPLVKVVYDIYHQQVMEGNIITNITQNLDCIAHLHSAGHPGRREIWLGENDYHVIFDAVDHAGYQGCCGLEYNPSLSAEESLKMCRRMF